MSETKKSLGQHWLNDSVILREIVLSAEVASSDTVLEIGPGLGTLTDALLETGAEITALEYDKDLIKGLKIKFINTSQVKILEGDIRTFNFGTMPSPYKIVANIPYYLTSHLIRSISETSNPPSVAVLLIQKEVAERLCELPGQMSILAVTAQWFFECSLGVEVPARLFTPPPKVDSQVVILKRRESPLYDIDSAKLFRVVKAGFSEKRKTMRNSLSGGLVLSKEQVEALLDRAGIDSELRAQALSLEQWVSLAKALE